MIRILSAFVLGSVFTLLVTDLLHDNEAMKDHGFRDEIDDLLDNVKDLLSLP